MAKKHYLVSIIERNACAPIYTKKDRQEMLIFSSYLRNTLNILKYNDIEKLDRQQKRLNEELYHKHQENNKYRESIRSFLRSSNECKIGIVFYRNRRFKVANEAAREFIGFDLNVLPNHSLSLAFKTVVQRVEEYKSAQTYFSRDSKGNKVVISGIPSIEDQTIIMHIQYPEISDVLKSQLDQLKDPSAWDYVLYLRQLNRGSLLTNSYRVKVKHCSRLKSIFFLLH